MPTHQGGCSGCPSQEGKDNAVENHSPRPGDPCHCNHHQNIDVAVAGHSTVLVVTPQVRFPNGSGQPNSSGRMPG